MKSCRLAIVSSHPIQYNAPLFRLLANSEEIALKVFYTWSQSAEGQKFDPGFGRSFEWDIPLLSGYDYEFVQNTSRNPGSHHFSGIINPGLPEKVLSWKPDIVLIYGWSFMSHLQLMRKLKGRVKIIFRGDSHLLDENSGYKKVLRRIALHWIYKKVDVAYFTGQKNLEYFKAAGLRPKQLVFVPHTVENERFTDESGELQVKADLQRKELGIADTDIVFLFAGKFEAKKNIELLIKAFKAVELQNIKLLLVGNGPLEVQLREQAASDNRIQFLGFQNQSAMPVIYRIADVVTLVSSYNETWGLAINEAMASSRAIIASDVVGCVSDLVQHGTNGIIFPRNDSKALADAIRHFGSDSSFLKNAKFSSGKIIQNWDVKIAGKLIIDHLLNYCKADRNN